MDLFGIFNQEMESQNLMVKLETLRAISSFVTSAPFEWIFDFKKLLTKMLETCYYIVNNN